MSPAPEIKNRSLQENKTHLSEREFMGTIISMSGSRCQQYFLLSGLERSNILSASRRNNSQEMIEKLEVWKNPKKAAALFINQHFLTFLNEGVETKKRKGASQHTDALMVPDNRRKPGLGSRLPHTLTLHVSHYLLYIFHFGPSNMFQCSAWIYSSSEPPSWRGAARRDAEADLSRHHLFYRLGSNFSTQAGFSEVALPLFEMCSRSLAVADI